MNVTLKSKIEMYIPLGRTLAFVDVCNHKVTDSPRQLKRVKTVWSG